MLNTDLRLRPNLRIAVGLLALASQFIAPQISFSQVQIPPDQLNTLQAVTGIPQVGTFWTLKGRYPKSSPPPLPFFPEDLQDLNLPVYSFGEGQYLVDDSQVDYSSLDAALAVKSVLAGVENGSLATMNEEQGFSFALYSAQDLWLDITLTNSLPMLTLHSPETNAAYDVFGTTNLSSDVPGLNATNWIWVTRTLPNQSEIILSSLWPEAGFFRLATLTDTDGDGLTDAFERLVSHTDPGVYDSGAWQDTARSEGTMTFSSGLVISILEPKPASHIP